MVGTVVKARIGELEDEVREGSSIRMSKELTGVVQGVHTVAYEIGRAS